MIAEFGKWGTIFEIDEFLLDNVDDVWVSSKKMW